MEEVRYGAMIIYLSCACMKLELNHAVITVTSN